MIDTVASGGGTARQVGIAVARETGVGSTSAGGDEMVAVVITADGYLRMPHEFCARHFASDRAVGLRKNDSFILMPASVYAPNGIIMKQRNLAGERSTLIREVWGDDYPVGEMTAVWQGARHRLVIGAHAGLVGSEEASSATGAADAMNNPRDGDAAVSTGPAALTDSIDLQNSGTVVHTVREDGV